MSNLTHFVYGETDPCQKCSQVGMTCLEITYLLQIFIEHELSEKVRLGECTFDVRCRSSYSFLSSLRCWLSNFTALILLWIMLPGWWVHKRPFDSFSRIKTETAQTQLKAKKIIIQIFQRIFHSKFREKTFHSTVNRRNEKQNILKQSK